ncbi:DUF4280 domain-containing protein [Chryseobacterium salipaludis]|uniref:PAAR-like protein n=1 Tax=Chryseobacterium TaxID=59732 RepID=UPI001FF136C5|nr:MULTISPECIES: PAAR-like protein [Chryseobacterium]MCJ8498293.1 DUF4280 domain-containing protein [Chryseobacterium salipaludis]MCX3297461.1 PAAR-like protein [Planobacterium sp. JC490]
MAESYVPQDTTAVCTMMTNGAPQMIKITSLSNVMYSTKTQPFLTIRDNKLSGSFQCKAPAKFWDGLQALALGIAIGAAIVLTGGAAAVVIVAACAISVAAGGAALYKMAHDCDATLDREWQKVHEKVRFNQGKAILNRSYLDCPKKGKITIIMDPVIAQRAADFLSNNNNKEVMMQMGSQLVMGVITGGTVGASVTAVGVTGALTLALYTPSEAFGDTDFGSNNEGAARIISAVGSDVVTAGVGAGLSATHITTEVGGTIINSNVGNAEGGLVQYGAGSATGNITRSFEGAIRNFIGHRGLKDKKFAGYKGIAGFIANIAIGTFADKYENSLAAETTLKAQKFNESDMNKGINVIATKA